MGDHRPDQLHRPPALERTRKVSVALICAGILIISLTTALIALALQDRTASAQRSARLSATEVAQIRDLLADRRAQRDAEAAHVQAQLDDQARVLCAVITDFRARAHSDHARASLALAAERLDCARVGSVPAPTPRK